MAKITKRSGVIFMILVNLIIVYYFTMKAKYLEEGMKDSIMTYKEQINMVNEVNQRNASGSIKSAKELVKLYVITPTYARSSQRADLTMLVQTLMHVPYLHWIIVEDAVNLDPWIDDMLDRSQLPHTHLFVKTPAAERKVGVRGCAQRNAALLWLKHQEIKHGVMYFADDDNSYDVRVFEEFRSTKKVGLVPTGHLVKTGISSPVVKQGKVVNFVDVWKAGRKFPVEMASFAINIDFWRSRKAPLFDFRKAGFLETRILEGMKVTLEDLEPKASNCTEILVWHTRTIKVKYSVNNTIINKYSDSNIPKLYSNLA